MATTLSEDELQTRVAVLKRSPLFISCSDSFLRSLAPKMELKKYVKGEDLIERFVPHENIFFVVDGNVVRLVEDEGGAIHQAQPLIHENSVFGSLHVISGKLSPATLHCSSDVRAYVLKKETVLSAFAEPEFSKQIAQGLCMDILTSAGRMRTPLLEQQSRKINFLATTVAASFESFYRSALNSMLNRLLTKTSGPLFPDMHIQIPSRVLYINGLKGIRLYLGKNVDPSQYENPTLVRYLAATAPGLLMCPVSSVLEATNAHLNPEPVARKWIRGYLPRCVREVIFAIGLNQMSDYWTERVPVEYVASASLRAACGSLFAGVISGYLSHVPHNLGTMKLMNPTLSYGAHFREFARRSEPRVPAFVPSSMRGLASSILAIAAPVGVHIRTTQIVGSFVLLNGLIAGLS